MNEELFLILLLVFPELKFMGESYSDSNRLNGRLLNNEDDIFFSMFSREAIDDPPNENTGES